MSSHPANAGEFTSMPMQESSHPANAGEFTSCQCRRVHIHANAGNDHEPVRSCATFQASPAAQFRFSPLRDVTQRGWFHRRFGTAYRLHLQWASSPTRNVCNELAVRAAQHYRRAMTRVGPSSCKTNFLTMNIFAVAHIAVRSVSGPKFCDNFMFHLTPLPVQSTVMMQFTVHCIYIFRRSWATLPLVSNQKYSL
jgi:hypothetical protein